MCRVSAGARYCRRKLFADAEGHAPCSDKCGLSGSSEEAMVEAEQWQVVQDLLMKNV